MLFADSGGVHEPSGELQSAARGGGELPTLPRNVGAAVRNLFLRMDSETEKDMKRLILFLSTIAIMTGCDQKKTASVPAIDRSNFDETTAPNEDFYQYATGGWQKKNPLKPEFARYGTFDALRENNEVRINDLFAEMTKTEAEKGSVEQKIADLYTMGLDSTRLNAEALARAERRLKFDEFLGVQLSVQSHRTDRMTKRNGFVFSRVGEFFTDFFEHRLPFSLTGAQKRVIREIRRDTVSGYQMNRLLQGDVGSGKTMVALMSMLLAVDNGFQACMMAPTEILARQHFATVSRLTEGMDLGVAILTGSSKAAERRRALEGIASGEVRILVGTHALIEDKVRFANLGYVVIDEQHRFGVEQRARLWTKNLQPPHILVMTATPIPRTLAMTLYGDLDVSVIDELPPGRQPIRTFHYTDAARLKLWGFLRKQIAAGRQAYIVYPLIKESETMDYKDLEDGFESVVRDFPLPEYRVTVCHGKMKPQDKEESMRQFKEREADILVATSVIEVGVDVPNATVMVIESAERFGLSQLHQLRGRVGRGGEQSYCILMTGEKLSREARARLRAMCETNDGFRLAELDLKLRGAGDINGTQQSGVAFDLKIANPTLDADLLQTAKEAAIALLDGDPALARPEHAALRALRARHAGGAKFDFSMIS